MDKNIISSQRNFGIGEYLLPGFEGSTGDRMKMAGHHLIWTVAELLEYIMIEHDMMETTDIIGVRPAPNTDYFDKRGRAITVEKWLNKAIADTDNPPHKTGILRRSIARAAELGKVLVIGGPNEQGLTLEQWHQFGLWEAERADHLQWVFGDDGWMAGVGSTSMGMPDGAWFDAFWNERLDAHARAGRVVLLFNEYAHWWPPFWVGPWQNEGAEGRTWSETWPGSVKAKEVAVNTANQGYNRNNPIEAHLALRWQWWLRDLLPAYVPVICPEMGTDKIDPEQARAAGVPTFRALDERRTYGGINTLRKGIQRHWPALWEAAGGEPEGIVSYYAQMLNAMYAGFNQWYGGAWYCTGDGYEQDWAEFNLQRSHSDRRLRAIVSRSGHVNRVKIQHWAEHVLGLPQPEPPQPPGPDPEPQPDPANEELATLVIALHLALQDMESHAAEAAERVETLETKIMTARTLAQDAEELLDS
jgi:hypothetical protein